MTFPKIEPLEARIAPASLSISGVTVAEGNSGKTAATFTVTLSEAATEEITVSFSTADGTAISSGLFPDFESQAGTLTFAVGDTTKQITVQVLGEQIQESSEDFTVNLSNPSGTTTIDVSTATGTINADGDTLIGVGIGDATAVAEGAGVTSKFTVTLAQASTSTVTVTFATGATADTAKPAPGAFTDYLAQTGTLTFAPGTLTQEISIALTDDTFSEATEQFTVTLTGATNAAVSGKPTAVGAILNDGDTTVGIKFDDVQQVEGNADSVVIVRPTLSGPFGSNLNLTLTTQSGTAVSGSDFTGGTPSPLVIAAGQISANYSITVKGDSTYEGTESFFVNLAGVPAEITVLDGHPLSSDAQATARVYLFNDDVGVLATNKLRWTDVDGDIVTLTVSKGSLFNSLGTLLTGVITLVDTGTVGGKQLQLLDLVGNSGVSFGTRFAGASVTITAEPEAGYPLTSNGRVDVGLIQAALFVTQELQVIGVDLGTVTVDGDLAKITAGDPYSTPAISKLDVYSLGVNPASLGSDPSATSTTLRTQSDVLGPITTVNVKTDVEGYLHVLGAEFGTIGTLKVGGALKGGAPDNSGRVTASGRIGSATIGSIIGGTGAASGVLSGTTETNGKLGSVTILGDVLGGAGPSSGEIFSTSTIGAIKIGGKLGGGTGEDSGSIQSGGNITTLSLGTLAGGTGKGSGSVRVGVNNSGTAIVTFGNIGAVTITGKDASDDSIKGGTGVNSGRIDAVGSILSFTAAGDVQGGTGSGSGSIVSKTTIGAIKIGGKIAGAGGENSGSIQSGGKITSLSVGLMEGGGGKGSGSVRVGVDNAGITVNSLASIGAVTFTARDAVTLDSLKGGAGENSGLLDVASNIASINVKGNVHGAAANGSGAILAGGNIDKIVISGDLIGAASGAAAVTTSGAIKASWLKSVTIAGDIVAGAKGAGAITSSGAITAQRIDILTVGGKLTGNATNAVFISATGTLTDLAIGKLTVTGAVEFATIRAGYNSTTATSADASIGTVTFGSTVHGLNLIAGAAVGTDGRFGTADDVMVAGSSVKNTAGIVSKIASVIFKNVQAVIPDAAKYGIAAQNVVAITLGTTKIPLQTGPGNDRTPIELGGTTEFRVVELALV